MKKLLVAVIAILALSGCAGMGQQQFVQQSAVPGQTVVSVNPGHQYVPPPLTLRNGQWVPGTQLGYGQPVAAGSVNMGNLSMCQGLATAGGAVGGYVVAGNKNQLPLTVLGGVAGYVLGNIFCPQTMMAVQQQGQVTQGANQRVVMTAQAQCNINGETFEGLSKANCEKLGGMLGASRSTKEPAIGTKRSDGKEFQIGRAHV